MKITRALRYTLLCALAVPAFVSAAVETWTNASGQTMQAELIAHDGATAAFRRDDGQLFNYPIEKLSSVDHQRVLAAEDKRKSSLDPAPTAAADPATPAAAPVRMALITEKLSGKLTRVENGKFVAVKDDEIAANKYYAIYFSAHWCPPCRAFTPELVKAYAELKKNEPNFELIFVSSDRTEDKMLGYMKDYAMPFMAVKYSSIASLSALSKYRGNGIPNLVFVDGDGKVLSSSYEGSDYVGPQKVLSDMQDQLN
jgi:nucleoredoxin